MQFANPQEARDFLAQHPEVRLIELILIDANGIPRGTMTAATAMPPSPPQWCVGSDAMAAVARPESGAEGGGWSTGS